MEALSALALAVACSSGDGDGRHAGNETGGARTADGAVDSSTGNSGGAAGTDASDAGGSDGSDGDGSGGDALEQVRVIRGDPAQREWWDLTIRGDGLSDANGKVVRVRVGDPTRPPERLGSGQARIERDGFEIQFTQVWEAGWYKAKYAFIDLDDDGACAPPDLVFSDRRATPHFVLTLQNGPGTQLDMPVSSHPEEDCLVLNGPWPSE